MSDSSDSTHQLSLGVVVRTVSRPRYLRELIASIESQENKEFTVIAINNGGDDETQGVLLEWSERSEVVVRIRRNPQNLPFDVSQEMRSFSHLIFPGDDDLLVPEATKHIWHEMRTSPHASLLAFSSKPIGPRGWRLPTQFRPCLGHDRGRVAIMARLLGDACLIFSATVFSTAALMNSGINYAAYPYVADWLLYLVGTARGEVVTSHRVILKSRLHARQDWRIGSREAIEEQQLRMLLTFIGSCPFEDFLREIGEPGRAQLFDEFLDYARSQLGRKRDFLVYGAVRNQEFMVGFPTCQGTAPSNEGSSNALSGEWEDMTAMQISTPQDIKVESSSFLHEAMQHIVIGTNLVRAQLRADAGRLYRRRLQR